MSVVWIRVVVVVHNEFHGALAEWDGGSLDTFRLNQKLIDGIDRVRCLQSFPFSTDSSDMCRTNDGNNTPM